MPGLRTMSDEGHLDRPGQQVYAAHRYHFTGAQGTRREEPQYAVSSVPAAESAPGEVLPGVWRPPGVAVRPVWHSAASGREILPRVRATSRRADHRVVPLHGS